MYIRWHGHSCFEVGDEVVLVTDPHDGKSIGIKPPQVLAPDIITVSHAHFDHNAFRAIEGPGTEVVEGPIRAPVEISGVRLRGVGTFHDDMGGQRRGENTAVLWEMGGLTLCHLGDLGCVPDDGVISAIGRVDILFVPVGGTFTVDAEAAWRVVDLINPRVCVPMHYKVGGLSLPLTGVERFIGDSDAVEYVGNEMEFTEEDLPESGGIWVFSL